MCLNQWLQQKRCNSTPFSYISGPLLEFSFIQQTESITLTAVVIYPLRRNWTKLNWYGCHSLRFNRSNNKWSCMSNVRVITITTKSLQQINGFNGNIVIDLFWRPILSYPINRPGWTFITIHVFRKSVSCTLIHPTNKQRVLL